MAINPPPVVVNPPTNVVVRMEPSGIAAAVSWTDAAGATGTQIRVTPPGVIESATAKPLVIRNLGVGQTYEISARHWYGNEYSVWASVEVTPAQSLSPPTDVTVRVEPDGVTATVSWKDAVGALSTQIRVTPPGVIQPATVSSSVIRNLEAEQTYEISVRHQYRSGSSDWVSAEVTTARSATTDTCRAACAARLAAETAMCTLIFPAGPNRDACIQSAALRELACATLCGQVPPTPGDKCRILCEVQLLLRNSYCEWLSDPVQRANCYAQSQAIRDTCIDDCTPPLV